MYQPKVQWDISDLAIANLVPLRWHIPIGRINLADQPTSLDCRYLGTSYKVDNAHSSGLSHLRFTITELTSVMDTDFHHFAHLLSWNQKSPPPKRRASEWVAVNMTTGWRRHKYLHPAPWCLYPLGTGTPRASASRTGYSIVKTPPSSLLMLTNIIYNHVFTRWGESRWVYQIYIALWQNLLYTDNSLQKQYSHISCIGSGRMTISIVSCKFDTDKMYLVGFAH